MIYFPAGVSVLSQTVLQKSLPTIALRWHNYVLHPAFRFSYFVCLTYLVNIVLFGATSLKCLLAICFFSACGNLFGSFSGSVFWIFLATVFVPFPCFFPRLFSPPLLPLSPLPFPFLRLDPGEGGWFLCRFACLQDLVATPLLSVSLSLSRCSGRSFPFLSFLPLTVFLSLLSLRCLANPPC